MLAGGRAADDGGDLLQFQDRPATESAAKNRDDGTHELKHAGDITAAHPKALDFSERSEFLVAIGLAGSNFGNLKPRSQARVLRH